MPKRNDYNASQKLNLEKNLYINNGKLRELLLKKKYIKYNTIKGLNFNKMSR